MSAPLLSVILGVYNGIDFLDSAVNCIVSQNYSPLEIIIVDDGSTDQTADAAENWKNRCPDQIRLIQRANGGVAAARNTGLQAARGEFIAILDVDDLWMPGTLNAFFSALIANPQAAVVQGYIRRTWITETAGGPRYERDFVPYLAMNAGSLFFRRSVFDTVGLFDERPSQNEDTDMHLRIREAGLKIYVLERLALIYRMHGRNITHGVDLKEGDFFKVLYNSLQRRRASGASGSLDGLHYFGDAARPKPSLSAVIPLDIASTQSAPDPALRRTLDSIAAQNYPDIEIIIVHPEDLTPAADALAAGYPGAWFRMLGLPRWDLLSALNAGAQAASGELIAWCQPGDAWSSHRLRMQLGYLLPGRPEQAVTGLVRYVIDPTQSYPAGLPEHLDGRGYQDVLGTLLIRRSLFTASGGFTTTSGFSPLASLTDWFMRIKESGAKVNALPRYIVFKHLDPSQPAGRYLGRQELLSVLHAATRRKIRQ
jgi:glycosyltransferase involved in cell wall biosynthesis